MNHSTFKSFTFGIGLFSHYLWYMGIVPLRLPPMERCISINRKPTKVAPVKYGFHYEEIGMMGEGALHAELIRKPFV